MNQHDSRPRTAAPFRTDAGFSMIEVLVAAAILTTIALGLVPLYSRAIRSNVEGFDYTQVSNFAKSRAEEFLQLPFAHALLVVPDGSTERVIQDFYSSGDHRWYDSKDDLAAGDEVVFTRTTTIRQFDTKDLTKPLNGTAALDAVHLKEITVRVEGSRVAGSPLGAGKEIAVRVLKSE